MRLKVTILAALAAFTISAQQQPVAAKPAETPKVGAPAPVAPVIPTATLWRLVSKVQAMQIQLDGTEQAKALKAAQAELQTEQQRLAGICGAGFTLGYGTEGVSKDDIVCVKQTPAPTPPADITKK